jgi:hypothetical protein
VASWAELEREAPELAARARERFDARVHKTIATLRRDGSPRISGIETIFAAGEVWFGSMWKAVKAIDLRRDPRFALHSGSEDPPAWSADAKLAGRAEEVSDQTVLDQVLGGDDDGPRIGSMHLFRAEIDELVWTGLNDDRDKLIVDSWREGRGLRRIER